MFIIIDIVVCWRGIFVTISWHADVYSSIKCYPGRFESQVHV